MLLFAWGNKKKHQLNWHSPNESSNEFVWSRIMPKLCEQTISHALNEMCFFPRLEWKWNCQSVELREISWRASAYNILCLHLISMHLFDSNYLTYLINT